MVTEQYTVKTRSGSTYTLTTNGKDYLSSDGVYLGFDVDVTRTADDDNTHGANGHHAECVLLSELRVGEHLVFQEMLRGITWESTSILSVDHQIHKVGS